MKKTAVGLIAGVASMGLAAVAFASDRANEPSSTSTMRHDTTTITRSNDPSASHLMGRVVKSDAKTVWIEHQGAIVPLKVDPQTKFEGANLKGATDLKQGAEIRVSFMIKDQIDNVAQTIALAGGTGLGGSGGSGLDKTLTPGYPPPVPTVPEKSHNLPKQPGDKTY